MPPYSCAPAPTAQAHILTQPCIQAWVHAHTMHHIMQHALGHNVRRSNRTLKQTPWRLLEPDGSSFTFLVGEERRKAETAITGLFLIHFPFSRPGERTQTCKLRQTSAGEKPESCVCVFCLRVWKRLLTSDRSGCELMHHPESCHH